MLWVVTISNNYVPVVNYVRFLSREQVANRSVPSYTI